MLSRPGLGVVLMGRSAAWLSMYALCSRHDLAFGLSADDVRHVRGYPRVSRAGVLWLTPVDRPRCSEANGQKVAGCRAKRAGAVPGLKPW